MNATNTARRRMKPTKIILIGLPILLGVFSIVVALQPRDYKVVRSTSIAAPPSAVFAHIDDLRKFQRWSPWAKVDPNCKYTYDGPEAGTGSAFSWEGDAKVGAGKMTITVSRLNELVRADSTFSSRLPG